MAVSTLVRNLQCFGWKLWKEQGREGTQRDLVGEYNRLPDHEKEVFINSVKAFESSHVHSPDNGVSQPTVSQAAVTQARETPTASSSSGVTQPTAEVKALLEVIEAQARGFAHGHMSRSLR